MNDKQLAIVISVIDQASEQLGALSTQLSGLADDTQVAAEKMTGSMTQAEDAIIAAAEKVVASWDTAATDLGDSMTAVTETMDADWMQIANSGALAATASSDAWKTSLTELQTMLAETATAAEGEFGAMGAASAASSGGELKSSVSSLGGKASSLGYQSAFGGAMLFGGAYGLVDIAGTQQQALAQIANTVKNSYSAAETPASGLKTELSSLNVQIEQQRAVVAEADAGLQKWYGTSAQIAANHAKEAAAAAAAAIKIQQLTQERSQLTNADLQAGTAASAVQAQLDAAAQAGLNFGFTVTESAQSLDKLYASTNSSKEALAAYQDAMDLARATGISMAQATDTVAAALQGKGGGQGGALTQLGINIRDGLSGQPALAAIHQKVGGSAQTYSQTSLGQMDVAFAQLDQAGADMGKSLEPVMIQIAKDLDGIAKAIGEFAQNHPKVTAFLLGTAASIGAVLLVLSPFLILLGAVLNTIELIETLKSLSIFPTLSAGFTTVTNVLKTTLLPALQTFIFETIPAMWTAITTEIIPALLEWGATTLLAVGPYVLVGVAIAALVVLVVLYHKQIMQAIQFAWNWIINEVSDAMLLLYGWIEKELKLINALWTTIWTGISTFMTTIWDDIGAAVQKGIQFVEGLINDFSKTIQNVYKTIMAPINAISGAVSGVAGVIGGAVSGVAGAVGGAVGAAGSIVSGSAFNGSNSLGVVGGSAAGTNITVHINGGNYLDSQGATKIGNALARQIQLQLRLPNYA